MKHIIRLAALILAAVCVFGLCGCSQPLKVESVTVGGTKTAFSQSSGEDFKGVVPASVPYVDIGAKAVIVFSAAPDNVSVTDVLIEADGTVIYEGMENPSDVSISGKEASFAVNENSAVTLASDSEKFSGGCLRGYKITCKKGSDSVTYLFVIKTDGTWSGK